MSTKSAYKKAFNTWVESQKNTIEQVEINIANSENMIRVHKEALKISKKALKHEKELLEAALNNEAES